MILKRCRSERFKISFLRSVLGITADTARFLLNLLGVPPLGSGFGGIKKPFNAYGMGLFVRSEPYKLTGSESAQVRTINP